MSIQSIFFIDIETIPALSHSDDLTREMYDLYLKRFRSSIFQSEYEITGNPDNIISDDKRSILIDHYAKNAGLYAEFGKIISVSIGKLQGTKLYVKTITTDDEKRLLTEFAAAIIQAPILCAHNGKEFDFPYLFRRFLINKITVPAILNRMNKKTWDPGLEDTMELWSGTQWKYRCSLDLIANIFGIDSPKDEMSGSDVANIYYKAKSRSENEQGLTNVESEAIMKEAFDKIGRYNAKDVVTMVDVYARLREVSSYTEIDFR